MFHISLSRCQVDQIIWEDYLTEEEASDKRLLPPIWTQSLGEEKEERLPWKSEESK